jgi:hypothetical protein
LIFYTKGRTQIEGFEEDIWTEDEGCGGRLEKTAQ